MFPTEYPRRISDELPKTLDDTRERILLEIDEEKQAYAHRLFQRLVKSIRPLSVVELAELFAIPPDTETSLRFNIGWRPMHPKEAILSACSTLVSIVNLGHKKVVQFSHFSVRGYLTSNCITHSATVSHFRILPKPAYTLPARACLGVLLQLDDCIDNRMIQSFPLAWYAAEHWVGHVRSANVSSDIRDVMDHPSDKNKPHLAAWTRLYDVHYRRRHHRLPPYPTQLDAVPLSYAVLYGFRDFALTERLLNAHPQDVNARGRYPCDTLPLHLSLDQGHRNMALLLLERGAEVESRNYQGQTALFVSSCGVPGRNPYSHCGVRWRVHWMIWTCLAVLAFIIVTHKVARKCQREVLPYST